jgi:hypothetical protein
MVHLTEKARQVLPLLYPPEAKRSGAALTPQRPFGGGVIDRSAPGRGDC